MNLVNVICNMSMQCIYLILVNVCSYPNKCVQIMQGMNLICNMVLSDIQIFINLTMTIIRDKGP